LNEGLSVGFTVITYDDGIPEQELADGVTVMVAVIGTDPVLIALNPAIFPVPLAARPMAVFEFVQAKAVPETELVKPMAATAAPLQTVKSAGTLAVGIGLTVMV